MKANWRYILAVEGLLFGMLLLAMGCLEVAQTGTWTYYSGGHEYIYELNKVAPNYLYIAVSTVIMSFTAVVIRRERRKMKTAEALEHKKASEGKKVKKDDLMAVTAEIKKTLSAGTKIEHKDLIAWATEMERREEHDIIPNLEKPHYALRGEMEIGAWTDMNGSMRKGQRELHRAWTCAVENCPEEALETLEGALREIEKAKKMLAENS